MNHVSKEQEEIREKREKARIAREHKVELKRIAMVGYVVPTEDDKEAEKALRKIATKGGTFGFTILRCNACSYCLVQCNQSKQENDPND